MASYQKNPMFGQDYSLNSMFDFSAVGTDSSPSEAASPGVTSEPEGSGWSAHDIFNVVGQTIGLGTSIVNAASGQTGVSATPTGVAAGVPSTSRPGMGYPSATSSFLSSPILLIGGLGILAFLVMKK